MMAHRFGYEEVARRGRKGSEHGKITDALRAQLLNESRAVAVVDGLEVRIGAAGPRHASPADPVHLPAPWILHRGDLFVKDTAAEVRDPHPFHRIAGNGGQVDVEQRLPREVLDLDDALDQAL